MISRANRTCRPSTSTDTSPVPNAPRAVRPTRRTYSDGSRGKSNKITCDTPAASSPLLARSVHTSIIGVSPLRAGVKNFARDSLRRSGDSAAWYGTGIKRSLSRSARASTFSSRRHLLERAVLPVKPALVVHDVAPGAVHQPLEQPRGRAVQPRTLHDAQRPVEKRPQLPQHVLGYRRRDQHELRARRHRVSQRPNLLRELERVAEQDVALVHDDRGEVADVQLSALDEPRDAAGSADDDVDAFFQRVDLRPRESVAAARHREGPRAQTAAGE
eukprot:30237-Pelagococcus_subviridis.AAC.3